MRGHIKLEGVELMKVIEGAIETFCGMTPISASFLNDVEVNVNAE